ncbi:MAG: tRNA (guanosine(37)-N1)-methyltransferase TrmD [Candidatus Kapaibacteriota bacterium]
MRLDLLSAVPETFQSVINSSIIKKAIDKGKVEIFIHNLHDYADNKFGHIDDYPYGGGAGMLLQCEPIFKCIDKLLETIKYDKIIYMSADGEKLNQNLANKLSLDDNLLIICGHYKGIDQRIRDYYNTYEISIGDFILTGGELPALVLIDSIIRLLPGVIGDAASALDDSFMDGLLEPPQYTRPSEYKGMKVPEVLLSGNPKLISEWQQKKALEKTQNRRPDLLSDL